MAQVFRRENNPEASFRLKLKALEPKATYALADLSSDWKDKRPGRELMADGVRTPLPKAPSDALIVYSRVSEQTNR